MKIIAFIPARGGSKSIPLKNIKPLCGKPLICWNIEALEACRLVDEIIIATDSDTIAETVTSRHYTKTQIFRRSAQNASDTASTESVMLEYIQRAQLHIDTIFMLVQATSPLTQTCHFDEAINIYLNGKYDSILTCVRNYRFFWNADGTSKNYDYRNRPRRQNFEGELMENGAFYINKVANILSSQNRLSGKIGIYEMPEYTATEIDEPDDWIIIEKLLKKHVLDKQPKHHADIKLFVTDVDGVLTDGGMYYTENGDELKKFNTRDGMGIELLRNKGIKTAIITSEETKIVERRAKKLHIDYLYQGKYHEGKLTAVLEICQKEHISLENVAYIGDDINCYDLLCAAKLKACPVDAIQKIKEIPHIKILTLKGGNGCVREFIEYILQQ